MSRSGYSDDYGSEGPWGLIRWRGAVKAALKGKRGQAFLREMVEAMDAMPVKELTAHSLRDHETGAVCALGAVGAKRGMDLSPLDPDDSFSVASAFGLSDAMVREIVYENDEGTWDRETPAQRWQRMRDWAQGWIKDTTP
jgi:hypothetical protein